MGHSIYIVYRTILTFLARTQIVRENAREMRKTYHATRIYATVPNTMHQLPRESKTNIGLLCSRNSLMYIVYKLDSRASLHLHVPKRRRKFGTAAAPP